MKLVSVNCGLPRRGGASGSRNFANRASDGTWLPKQRALRIAPGESPTAQSSASRCRMSTSTPGRSPFDGFALA